MEDYCYKSSDKCASIGYCSHFKPFFFLLLFVKSGKFKTHFSTERVPSFGTPDLKWMRSVRCPDRNSQFLTSSARHVSHDFTSLDNAVSKDIAFGSLSFSPVLLLSLPFLLDMCCTVPKHNKYMHWDVVQSCRKCRKHLNQTISGVLPSLKKSDTVQRQCLDSHLMIPEPVFNFVCEFDWLFFTSQVQTCVKIWFLAEVKVWLTSSLR